jgi:hypothetical protein
METGLTAVGLLMITALIAAEMIFTARRRRQDRQRDAVLRRLQGDLHALVAGAVSVDQHLAAVEQRLRRLAERQDQLELRDPVQQTYDHAIRLIQQGADIGALMEQCALARGEAELLLRVHRAPRQTAAG